MLAHNHKTLKTIKVRTCHCYKCSNKSSFKYQPYVKLNLTLSRFPTSSIFELPKNWKYQPNVKQVRTTSSIVNLPAKRNVYIYTQSFVKIVPFSPKPCMSWNSKYTKITQKKINISLLPQHFISQWNHPSRKLRSSNVVNRFHQILPKQLPQEDLLSPLLPKHWEN